MENPVTSVELDFADGRYLFWLPLPQMNELERQLSERSSIPSVFALEWHLRGAIALNPDGTAIYAGGDAASVPAIRDTIRLALIGGNRAIVVGETSTVSPKRAAELLDAYIFPARPLSEAAALAWRIVGAAIFGNGLDTNQQEIVDE